MNINIKKQVTLAIVNSIMRNRNFHSTIFINTLIRGPFMRESYFTLLDGLTLRC